MKNVILGTIFVALIFAISQVRARGSSSLKDYYSEYLAPYMSASEQAEQSAMYPGCKPYGDNTVGYFKTEEEYSNA